MEYIVAIGTFLHLFTLTILLWKIHKTGSLHGISGKSQLLFAVVYTTRSFNLISENLDYLDRTLKLVSIFVPYIICYFIYDKFKTTHNHNHDTFRIDILLIPATILAVYFNGYPSPQMVFWVFSIYLESVTILPQFYMIIKTGEVERLTLYYLYAMGLYSIAYVPQFPYRFGYFHLFHIIPKAVQISIYCAFFAYKCHANINTYIDVPEVKDSEGTNNQLQSNLRDVNINKSDDSRVTGCEVYLNVNDLKNNKNNLKFNKMVHEQSSLSNT